MKQRFSYQRIALRSLAFAWLPKSAPAAAAFLDRGGGPAGQSARDEARFDLGSSLRPAIVIHGGRGVGRVQFFLVFGRERGRDCRACGGNPRSGTDLSRIITGIAPIDRAGANDLTFVKDAQYAKALATTEAGAVLTTERFAQQALAGIAVLTVRKPYEAFVTVARHMYGSALRPVSAFGTQGIAPSAIVHPTAQIGPDVTIDPFVVIGPSVKIGAGSLIAAHAMIGERVEIGPGCAIGAGCSITHAHVGDRVVIHPGCHIGQDGFGYVSDGKGHIKIPQIGRVVIHGDVEIGSGTKIDRGGLRDTVIGEGTKIDNLCQIGHNCIIGRHCIIVAQSGLSGSVTLEDFVVLGPRTGIIPHVTVGKGAMLLSRSTVYESVPAGAVWGGFPAQPRRQWMREILALRNLTPGGSRART